MAKKNGKEVYTGEFGVNNQLFFCGIPFRLDTYSGCQHYCRYCFARSSEITNNAVVSSRSGKADILLPDHTQFMRKMAIALDWGESRADINIEWLRRRVPIHWGGMSDPFQPCELEYKISSKWMDRINWYNYPVAISTKGTTIATMPEYMQKLKEGNYAIQITLIGDDDELIKKIEPNAPSATERLIAINKFAEAEIPVIVRIQPVFPATRLEEKLPEFIEKLAKAGVQHVTAEGYKMQMRNKEWLNYLSQLMPECVAEYNAYCKDYFGFEKLLPSWRKWQYVKVIRDACHEFGMTFGAADNDMRDLGDTICCCGLDNIKGFENFWRYQSSQAAVIAKEKGTVALEDMQQFWSGGGNSMDSGNTLNNEMYMEIYGYQKGTAGKNKKKGSGLIHLQDGEMRKEARANNRRYTAKYCVDWMWNKGGECSPECIISLNRRVTENGQVVYDYSDPISKLESQQIKQGQLF